MNRTLSRSGPQVVGFFRHAKKTGLWKKLADELIPRFERFDTEFSAYVPPEELLRSYRLQLAPLQVVFDRTHLQLKALITVATGWSESTGRMAAFQADSGPLRVGEDEEQDLAHLQKIHAAFVQHFGEQVLPPELKASALRKLVHEHEAALRQRPEAPGQKLRAARADERRLAAEARALRDIMHDFLDGQFGTKGEEAARKKAEYHYDRNLLRKPHTRAKKDAVAKEEASAKKAVAKAEQAMKKAAERAAEVARKAAAKAEEAAKKAVAKAEAAEKKAAAKAEEAAKTAAPKTPGPVASGTAGAPPSSEPPAAAAPQIPLDPVVPAKAPLQN